VRVNASPASITFDSLVAIAHDLAPRLAAQRQTLAVAESSAGGLISAALLAVPGASAYFLGGAVVYTQAARSGLVGIETLAPGMRASTEPYALFLARTVRDRLGATWGLAETGASGPSGNRYGDPPGHVCLAVVGPRERSLTVETASPERLSNMLAFAAHALRLLADVTTTR
jgi:PncC family amidohydrolase